MCMGNVPVIWSDSRSSIPGRIEGQTRPRPDDTRWALQTEPAARKRCTLRAQADASGSIKKGNPSRCQRVAYLCRARRDRNAMLRTIASSKGEPLPGEGTNPPLRPAMLPDIFSVVNEKTASGATNRRITMPDWRAVHVVLPAVCARSVAVRADSLLRSRTISVTETIVTEIVRLRPAAIVDEVVRLRLTARRPVIPCCHLRTDCPQWFV